MLGLVRFPRLTVIVFCHLFHSLEVSRFGTAAFHLLAAVRRFGGVTLRAPCIV